MNKISRETDLAAAGTIPRRLAVVGTTTQKAVRPTCRRPLNCGAQFVVLLLTAAVLAGCSGGESTRPAAPAPSAQVAPPPPPPPPSEPKAPETVLKKAEKGVGEKGHYDSNAVVTVIATPIASYFAMRERIAFDIQLPEAMKLFKASEGRAPKSHEEFMERIIKEQHINLPTLPEGHRYLYDPKTEQLMVEQPAAK